MILAKINQDVEYKGLNRPYLKGRKGTVTNLRAGGSSVLVYFPAAGDNGDPAFEWIGISSLELWVDKDSYSVASLNKKLGELDNEYAKLADAAANIRQKMIAIESKRGDLRNAINALKSLGSH